VFNALGQSDSILSEKPKEVEFIEYPNIDLSIGFGLLWLFQFNITYSPFDHFYFQPRASSSFVINEFGFNVGYQTKVYDGGIIRLGVGFSKGGKERIDPGGGTASETDRWETLYFRIGLLTKSKLGTLINPNLNVIRGDHNTVFSVNLTYAFILS